LNQVLAEPDIRLLATHRSDRPLRMELMESVVARHMHVVHLSELGPDRMADYVAARLQGTPAAGLTADVQAASAGNIFAAKLLLDEAEASGDLVVDGGIWSLARPFQHEGSQIQELLRHRLATYPRHHRQLIDLLAVGEPLSVDIIGAVTGADALEELRKDGVVRIQEYAGPHGGSAVTVGLNHVMESVVARQVLEPGKARELRLAVHEWMPRDPSASLWDLFRRVALEQDVGLLTPEPDLLTVATAANDLHDSQRARKAASAVIASELRLPAGIELARAMYLTGDMAGSVQLLRRLVASSDAGSADFLGAVWLLVRALYPTAPGPHVLKAAVEDARRRVEAAVATSPGEAAGQAQDELDVLQMYLDAQNGSWPRPSDPLYQRLCQQHAVDDAVGLDGTGRPAPGTRRDVLPSTEAGVMLMALVSQGLAVGGRFAEAVELSTAALESLERLPRCTVDFQAAVLVIHGSNLIWRGQWGGKEMLCSGTSQQAGGRLRYFEGPAHLYRAFLLARQGSLELACEYFRQAKARFDETDPEGLLPPTLGGLAAAAWLMGDVGQVRRALAAYDARRRSGSYLAARLADSYSSAARSVVSGASASNRRLLHMADAAGKRGHRALELLDLGLAARTGARGLRFQDTGAADLAWNISPEALAEISDLVPAPQGGAEAGVNEDTPTHEGLPRAGSTPATVHQGAAAPKGVTDIDKLSNREREVAGLIASGLSSAEAAVRLGISVNTVNAHLQRTYGKLGVSSRQELSEVWSHSEDFPD
jgi:DNA-binding CsgD family transcriptional regulator